MSKQFFLRSVLVLFLTIGIKTVIAQSFIDDYMRHIRDSIPSRAIYQPQSIPVDESVLLGLINKLPSFGLGRDNYFISGVATNKSLSEHHSDIKYQVSIRQRLLKNWLPWHSMLMFSYTQKSFWNFYEESSPFKDNNYNPSIGLTKLLIFNGKMRGTMFVFAEHESNGKDSIDSRSWNFLSASGIYFFNPQMSFQAKMWLPFVGDGNKDLLNFKGLGMCAINMQTKNERIRLSLILNPHLDVRNVNTNVDLNIKIFKNTNQYLFVQYYYGYAEGLLNYNRFSSMLRVGICMKQGFLTYY